MQRLLNSAMVVVFLAAFPLAGSQALAQNIAWGGAAIITGDANLLTAGVYFDAFIPNPSRTTALTADGVTFNGHTGTDTDGKISYVLTSGTDNAYGNNTLFAGGSAAFNAVMNAGGTFETGGAGAGTVTISGLTPGDAYSVQVFNYAGDGDTGLTTFSGSPSVTVSTEVGGVPTQGQFATGTFTATNPTETFNWTGAGSSYTVLGAISVRDTTAAVLPPALSQDITPLSAVAYLNSTSTFTAVFTGESPIYYQWLVSTNGGGAFGPVAGATNSTLTLVDSQLVANVEYYLVATNTYGTNHSSTATLSVVPPPAQDVAWGNATGITGDADLMTNGTYFDALMPNSSISPAPVADGVTFNVAANLGGGVFGDAKISFAGGGLNTFGWPGSYPVGPSASSAFATVMDDGGIFQNGGGGTGTVTLSQLTAGHRYSVQVFNYAPDGDEGLTTFSGSTPVTLSNLPGPNGNGQFATGIFTASGSAETFNWTGAGSSYTVLGAISVREITAVVTIAPTNVVNQGDPATVSVNLYSSLTSYYQWQTDNGSGGADWSNISGANASNYVVNTSGLATGNYAYQVMVTNSAINVTSAPVVLTVLAPSAPVVLQNPTPAATSRYVGQSAIFTAAFGGNHPLTNQWQFSPDGNSFQNISGATNSTLTVDNLQSTNAGSYRLVAANYLGSTPSAAAILTVLPWSAAHIQWSAPVPIPGLTAGQILTNSPGAYLEGAIFFPDAFIEVSAGNQPFAFRSDGVSVSLANPDFYAGEFVTNATYGSGALGTNTTGDANFDSVLNQYFDGGATNLVAVHNLTVGQQYSVQLFALDNREGMTGNLVNFADSIDTNDVSATFAMGDNSYVTGTFTATGTDQIIRENLLTGGFGNINAVVVRALSYVPALKPAIVVQPREQISLPTRAVFFPVITDGALAPVYQWKAGPVGGPYTNLADNLKFTGTATRTLSVLNVTTNDVLELVVAVTNSAGGTISLPVDLAVPTIAQPVATAPPIRITCIGASDVSSPTPYGTPNWPDYITSMLGYEYTVTNCGASGTTMIQQGNAPYWDTAQYTNGLASAPDIVIIMLGSNDSKPYNWIYQTNYVPDYEQMIAQYRNLPSHPRIYLNTLLTVYGPGNYDITDPIVTGELCPIIKQIAFDETFPLIDVNAATKNMPQNFPDNVHPNIAGAQVVAQTIFNGLMSAGETPPLVNQALNQPVTASSVAGGTTAANAVDGNFMTEWSSSSANNQWIYVDLGTAMHLTGVYLNWGSAYAVAYKIQVSNDAVNWTDAYSTTSGVGGFDRISLSADGRYVRMLGIQSAANNGFSLWDFTVTAVALAPALNISPAVSGSLNLFWPTSTVPFVLESTTNLASPTSWIPVTNSITNPGGSNTVSIDPTVGGLYFRLKY